MTLSLLNDHRRVFREKQVLSVVYGVWFDRLIAFLPPRARVLEAGAGPGLFAPHAKARRPDLRWVALDLIAAPWNDIVADAQTLPFQCGTFDAVVGVDFVHHLATPLAFCREAARVLKPGGELRVVEPWVSPFSYPIYRFLHQEGASLGLDPAKPFQKGDAKEPFEGDAGVTRALAHRVNEATWISLGFVERPAFVTINAFAYLMSLGFKRGSLLPRTLAAPVIAFDAWLKAALTALRVEIRATARSQPYQISPTVNPSGNGSVGSTV